MIPLLHPAGKSFAGALPGPFTAEGQRIMLLPSVQKPRQPAKRPAAAKKKKRAHGPRGRTCGPHAEKQSLAEENAAPAQTSTPTNNDKYKERYGTVHAL